jgi:hypothetical protein
LGALLNFLAIALPATAQEISDDLFSSGGLSSWTEKSFKGNTRDELVRDVDLVVWWRMLKRRALHRGASKKTLWLSKTSMLR